MSQAKFVNHKTVLCNRGHAPRYDESCTFYHGEDDRRLNYFGRNVPWTNKRAEEVKAEKMRLEHEVNSVLEELDVLFEKKRTLMDEARNKGIYLNVGRNPFEKEPGECDN